MRYRGALAALALLLLTACDGEPPAAGEVRAHLERALPGVRFRQDAHVRLGRFTMAMVRGLVRVTAAEDRETRAVMGTIRRLEVATWSLEGPVDLGDVGAPRDLERRLLRGGWQPMVRYSEEGSLTWVFVRPDAQGAIRNLYIVALDSDELTVVDLAGRIDEALAAALADDPGGIVADVS